MPFDREETLKKAEKLLRQGRLDQAIVEYERVVEDQPGDWGTANTLGDLYVRAGRPTKAAEQFARIADNFMNEGFYPRAAALYKKLLKLDPRDERSLLNLADVSHKQGLLADAKAYLNTVAERRRSRGDAAGVAAIIAQLGTVDPADIDARLAGARALVESGKQAEAAMRFRAIYDDLTEKGRGAEALAALREAVRLNPEDQETRLLLARAAVAAGDFETARSHLDVEQAGADSQVFMALLEVHLRSRQTDGIRSMLPKLRALGREERQRVLQQAWTIGEGSPDALYVLAEATADAAAVAREFGEASTILQDFLARVPAHVPALLKLVDVCAEGGLEARMFDAQTHLADAYLENGQADKARHVAEALVAREPWERAHIDRFRRALVMLKIAEPDTVIAERLNGDTPFTATDRFASPAAQGEAGSGDRGGDPRHSPGGWEPSPARGSGRPLPVAASAGDLRPPARTSPLEASQRAVSTELQRTLSEFQSDIQRHTGADRAAHHMSLARSHLEKGMTDVALGSLEIAAHAPTFRFEAAALAARIHAGRGDAGRAIEWFERAAEAPAPTVDEARALLYDLGRLVEDTGDTARALAIFLELQAEAGDYRDVAARVERLTRVEAGG